MGKITLPGGGLLLVYGAKLRAGKPTITASAVPTLHDGKS